MLQDYSCLANRWQLYLRKLLHNCILHPNYSNSWMWQLLPVPVFMRSIDEPWKWTFSYFLELHLCSDHSALIILYFKYFKLPRYVCIIWHRLRIYYKWRLDSKAYDCCIIWVLIFGILIFFPSFFLYGCYFISGYSAVQSLWMACKWINNLSK